MNEFEELVKAMIERFDLAVHAAMRDSKNGCEIDFVCPICDETAHAFCEEDSYHAFCPKCGVCAIGME